MSHIEGHVEEGPGSCGKLHLVKDDTIKFSFTPPTFDAPKNTRIGFHPIFTDSSHQDIIAVDVVLWSVHEAAEAALKRLLPGAFNRLEEIHKNSSVKQQVTDLLRTTSLSDEHQDVIRKSLDYFKQKEFEEFYVVNGTADSAAAEQKIIDIMSGKPTLMALRAPKKPTQAKAKKKAPLKKKKAPAKAKKKSKKKASKKKK